MTDKQRHVMWTRDWQDRRQIKGICITCGDKHEGKNPRTQVPFARCGECRRKLNDNYHKRMAAAAAAAAVAA